MTVDTYREEEERMRKDTGILTTGGEEAKILSNMEALYVSVRSWGTREEVNIPFTDWKGFG